MLEHFGKAFVFAKNGAKKGVSLELQAKEGLEQLKVISRLETANIKVKLSAVMEEVEREEHEWIMSGE